MTTSLRERLELIGSLPAAGAPSDATAAELLGMGRRMGVIAPPALTLVTGYMYFASQAEAIEASLHARDHGWTTDIRGPEGLIQAWIVAASCELDLGAGDVDRIYSELGGIARELDGEFDGWERGAA